MKMNILGEDYKIHFVDEIENFPEYEGLCCNETKMIYVLQDLSERKKAEVLYHEIVHAIVYNSGLCQVISHEVEEILCEVVSKFFARLVLANSDIFNSKNN